MTYLHGEVIISKGTIPKDAKKINPTNGRYIIAESEVTGNHHCIEDKVGVELFEKDGVLYIKNSAPVDAFCEISERHTNITLEPDTWTVTPQQEYDYLAQEKRNVAD